MLNLAILVHTPNLVALLCLLYAGVTQVLLNSDNHFDKSHAITRHMVFPLSFCVHSTFTHNSGTTDKFPFDS